MSLSQREKMIAGQLYDPADPGLIKARDTAQTLVRKYNRTIDADTSVRQDILLQLLGGFGPQTVIRAPFHVDYGDNIHLGARVFVNFNSVFLDVCPIHVGDDTMIGPNVQFLAADHPKDADERCAGLEFGKPITVGRRVWIGGGAILLPGVTIANDAIIGAGAVVTRDVPQGATVVGNPARTR